MHDDIENRSIMFQVLPDLMTKPGSWSGTSVSSVQVISVNDSLQVQTTQTFLKAVIKTKPIQNNINCMDLRNMNKQNDVALETF